MFTFIAVLIFIVCLLLILIVLVQNSKGGGLASSFSSSNQIMGVKKTTDFLEKATWTLAVALFVLCLASTMAIPKGGDSEQENISDKMQEQLEQTPQTPETPDDMLDLSEPE